MPSPDDTLAGFEVTPLAIPLYVEGVAPVPGSSDEEPVRGYAVAIGWSREQTSSRRRRFQAPLGPSLLYLVSDPRRPRPVWVEEGTITRHFRSYLGTALEGAPAADDAVQGES